MPLHLGIDHGNFATKTSEHKSYPSGFTTSDSPFIENTNSLFYGGRYYSIGDRRMHVQNDKTKDDDLFILTLPGIADAIQKYGVNEQSIVAGVGLPIADYGIKKDALQHYFLRRGIRFIYAGMPYCCDIIDCKVFPQGYAALCKNYKLLERYSSITMADIGGYTVDILTVRENKPDKSSCASLPLGTIVLFNRIKDTLRQYGIQLSDDQIADAISGRVQHLKADLIRTTVEKHVTPYIKELHNALRERGIDLQLPIVFAGGGAELLQDKLKSGDIFTVDILDSFANAEGYKFLLG